MRVQDLQQLLSEFTDKLKGNAISDAKIYVAKDGYLEEIRRIEVHENNIIGKRPSAGIRLVMKTMNEKRIILPPGMVKDY
jgi:alkylation response protein AidB-like acyl-CoA dehydrogenase